MTSGKSAIAKPKPKTWIACSTGATLQFFKNKRLSYTKMISMIFSASNSRFKILNLQIDEMKSQMSQSNNIVQMAILNH